MVATALALSAADKAEADRLAKQNAAEEAAKTAQAIRDSYEVAKAQANADASHRAFRGVIAAGHTATGTPSAAAQHTIPVPHPGHAAGTAAIEARSGVPLPTVHADASQALQTVDAATMLPAPAGGHHAVMAPARAHPIPSPSTATLAASSAQPTAAAHQ